MNDIKLKKIANKIEELHKKKVIETKMYEEFNYMMNNFDYNSKLFYGTQEVCIDEEKVIQLLELLEKQKKII